MTPHRQLLADYAETGSEEAFRQLVEAYVGMVHGSALRMVQGNTPLAEDIAQTVFTDLARKAKSLSAKVVVGGWLHRRTCFAAKNALRSEARRAHREREAVEMNFANADEALAWAGPALDEAIDELEAADREAIVLRFFERWQFRAIGEALGTSEGAAQKRVERALEKLRGLLRRRGVALSAAALALAVSGVSASAAPAGLAAAVSSSALAGAHTGAGATMSTLKILAMTKLKIAIISALAVAALAAGTVTTTKYVLDRDPSYTPPPHPSPNKILFEAQADASAGRYKDAQAKFIWYRDNALKYEPSQVGVRDSFALMFWCQMADKYPPAMKKLKAIRMGAENELHKGTSPKPAQTDFIIALSIDQGLHDNADSLALFKWLDTHQTEVARKVYSLMEMQLIRAGEYALCDRYIDADQSYTGMLRMYKMQLKNAQNPRVAASRPMVEFPAKFFSNQVATLVALLAINNHPDEANRIADKALQELQTPEFTALLAEARNGKVPRAWPPGT